MTTDETDGFGGLDFDDASPEENAARERMLRLARTVGIEQAFNALMELAADGKIPAAARGAAARTILEMAGALNWRDRAAAEVTKNPAEMSGEELHAAIAKVQRRQRPRRAAGEGSDGVFG